MTSIVDWIEQGECKRCEELEAEIERLRAALRPFAKAAATINYKWGNLREDYRAVLLVDCESARAALGGDDWYINLAEENKRLRAENSMLVTEATVHDKTDADLAREISRLNAHITKQDAEIERLRAALRWVDGVAYGATPGEPLTADDAAIMRDIARAALEGK